MHECEHACMGANTCVCVCVCVCVYALRMCVDPYESGSVGVCWAQGSGSDDHQHRPLTPPPVPVPAVGPLWDVNVSSAQDGEG